MKIIRNVDLYWPRLEQLIEQIAQAKRQHHKHSHLEREARYIRTAIIACENRKDDWLEQARQIYNARHHIESMDDATLAYGETK